MSKAILKAVEQVLGRRAFLNRTAMTVGGVVAGVLGVAGKAEASPFHIACCWLCYQPNTCTYSDCASEWYWCCCSAGKLKHCHECYSVEAAENCIDYYACATKIKCSKIVDQGAVEGTACPECNCCLQ